MNPVERIEDLLRQKRQLDAAQRLTGSGAASYDRWLVEAVTLLLLLAMQGLIVQQWAAEEQAEKT